MTNIIKKSWNAAEVTIIKHDYLCGVPVAMIAAKLGRSRSSVRGKATCLQLQHDAHGSQWFSAEEDAFIQANAMSMTRANIAQSLGRTEGSITQRGRRLNISFDNPIKKARYEKNHTFFEVPTLENSYLAGLLAADGWIRPCNGDKTINQVGISLKAEDAHLLDHMRQATGYTGVIREYCVDAYPQAELRISGVEQWLIDLKKHWGLIPAKTFTLLPPDEKTLTPDQVKAFLVGFIEGDGYIAISGGTLKVSVVTASPEFADWLEQIFMRLGQAKPTRSLHVNGTAHYLDFYGANARRLCASLMEVGVHKLMRKWDIAQAEIAKHDLKGH